MSTGCIKELDYECFISFMILVDEEEEQEENGKMPVYDRATMPEFVISLDSTDDFLKQRIMNLPESVVAKTHNTEDGFNRRITEFRALNEEDATVLNYFDELEIHPEHLGECMAEMDDCSDVAFLYGSFIFCSSNFAEY